VDGRRVAVDAVGVDQQGVLADQRLARFEFHETSPDRPGGFAEVALCDPLAVGGFVGDQVAVREPPPVVGYQE